MAIFTKTFIEDDDRCDWMVRNFGMKSDCYSGVIVERMFYDILMDALGKERGFYFQFVDYSNGAKAFEVIEDIEDEIVDWSSTNGYRGQMSLGALVLASWTCAVNRCCWMTAKSDIETSRKFEDMFYKLMDLVHEHKEVCQIMLFLD